MEGLIGIDSSDLPNTVPQGAYHAEDGQNDFGYWTDMAQIALKTYVPYFEENNNNDLDSRGSVGSSDNPGADTTSYISLETIRAKIADLPIQQEAGLALRGNELGLLRLNQYFYPECKDEAYCGIALGVSQADHKIVRPVLDEIFGDGQDGVIGLAGYKWSRQSMRESALGFVSSRNHLSMKNDAGLWTTKVLHQVALGIYLTDAEAQAFVDLQTKAVVLTALPAFAPKWFGSQLGLDDALSKKAFYLKRYEAAIRKQVAAGYITTLDASHADYDTHVMKTAWGFLDALIFAGGLSVPGVIFSGLAAYYTGLTGTDFDINDPLQAPLLVMETIRNYPAVLGVPYLMPDGVDSDGNTKYHREAPLAGMGGYDKKVYGDDALEFRIRKEAPDGGDGLAYYHTHSIDWADSGVPVDGKPWSSRICPAKSMSYNMILAFWEAMDATNWYVDPDSKIERENGPVWWTNYELHRRCETLGTHVGLSDASRAHSSDLQGDYCSWSSWCGEGLECNRKWYSWSGSCKFQSNIKFYGESCSKNTECDNVFTDKANVDLACRYGKCGFQDGVECEDDHTIEFADYTDLPAGDQAGTAGAWSTIVGGGFVVSGAGVFFLRRPKHAGLKHAKMSNAADDKL
jgi:hypothetical protein